MDISDERLQAYGLNPKKFKNFLKYGKGSHTKWYMPFMFTEQALGGALLIPVGKYTPLYPYTNSFLQFSLYSQILEHTPVYDC